MASVALGACTENAGTDGTDEAGAEPVRGGTLVLAGPGDLTLANPLLAPDNWTQEVNRYLLFLPLIRYSPDLEYRPALAESWEMLGDTGVVFQLRRDVRWHDGEPTTAEDVAFTFRRARDPATAFPNSQYFAQWTGVTVRDSFTVAFSFEPHAEPLAALPFFPIAPQHVLDTIPAEAMRRATFNRNPVGNGPFRFVSTTQNDRWVFEANPDFPEALGGQPYIDRVVWRVITENSQQVAAIVAGDVHVALAPPSDQVASISERSGLELRVLPSRKFAFVGWNSQREPFGRTEVRRALSMAIDSREILNVLRSGFGERAAGPITPQQWAYPEDVEPLPHDPERARSLLTEIGFEDRDGDGVREGPDGDALAFALKFPSENAFNQNVAQMMQADLRNVGVRARSAPTEAGTLIQDISSPSRNFDAVLMGWETDFRVALRNLFHSDALGGPFQLASYENPAVDSLIDRAEQSMSRDEARPLWRDVQQQLRHDQPWSFLFYYPDVFLFRQQVRNADMDIRGVFVNLPQWWLADGGAAVDTARAAGDAAPAAERAPASEAN